MALILSYPLTQDFTTSHSGKPKGAVGRASNSIVGICLHVLESPIETYLAYLASPLNLADIRPNEHGSLHYGIESGGAIHQWILDMNTAWAMQGLTDPTWTLLPDYVGIDPDYLFIHIGVEPFLGSGIPTSTFRALAELVAYLCVLHSIAPDADHIIDHSELDSMFDECAPALATNLIASVQSLISQGNTDASINVAVLAQQVAMLQTQVDTLQNTVSGQAATIASYASHLTTVATVSVLGHLKASSTLAIDGTSGAASVKTLACAYQIVNGTQQIVTSIPAIVQFPAVVQDANSYATLGSFWKVMPNVAGLYQLRAHLSLDTSTWTAGKIVQLDIYKNGTFLQTIAHETIEAGFTGKFDISGAGDIVQATLTDSYQVYATTDDANSAKTIVSGAMMLEKIGA